MNSFIVTATAAFFVSLFLIVRYPLKAAKPKQAPAKKGAGGNGPKAGKAKGKPKALAVAKAKSNAARATAFVSRYQKQLFGQILIAVAVSAGVTFLPLVLFVLFGPDDSRTSDVLELLSDRLLVQAYLGIFFGVGLAHWGYGLWVKNSRDPFSLMEKAQLAGLIVAAVAGLLPGTVDRLVNRITGVDAFGVKASFAPAGSVRDVASKSTAKNNRLSAKGANVPQSSEIGSIISGISKLEDDDEYLKLIKVDRNNQNRLNASSKKSLNFLNREFVPYLMCLRVISTQTGDRSFAEDHLRNFLPVMRELTFMDRKQPGVVNLIARRVLRILDNEAKAVSDHALALGKFKLKNVCPKLLEAQFKNKLEKARQIFGELMEKSGGAFGLMNQAGRYMWNYLTGQIQSGSIIFVAGLTDLDKLRIALIVEVLQSSDLAERPYFSILYANTLDLAGEELAAITELERWVRASRARKNQSASNEWYQARARFSQLLILERFIRENKGNANALVRFYLANLEEIIDQLGRYNRDLYTNSAGSLVQVRPVKVSAFTSNWIAGKFDMHPVMDKDKCSFADKKDKKHRLRLLLAEYVYKQFYVYRAAGHKDFARKYASKSLKYLHALRAPGFQDCLEDVYPRYWKLYYENLIANSLLAYVRYENAMADQNPGDTVVSRADKVSRLSAALRAAALGLELSAPRKANVTGNKTSSVFSPAQFLSALKGTVKGETNDELDQLRKSMKDRRKILLDRL